MVAALQVGCSASNGQATTVVWPSGSMEPTIPSGSTLVVDEAAFQGSSPERFDIVVVDLGEGAIIVKRVVAFGGEAVEVRSNQLFVDANPVDEPYLSSDTNTSDFGPWQVPAAHVFLLADNRASRSDSRVFGPVSEADILGRVVEIRDE